MFSQMERGSKSFLSWLSTELDFIGALVSVPRGSKTTVYEKDHPIYVLATALSASMNLFTKCNVLPSSF